MRFRLPWFALTCGIALLFGTAKVLAAREVRVAEREILSPQQVYGHEPVGDQGTRQLLLTVAYFSDGAWSRTAVFEATRDAVQLLAQCDVRLQRLEMVQIDAPRRYRYFDTPISRELARALRLPKPTVYFVADTHQQPAFDAEAIGRGNSTSRPELADSVWVTRATRDVGIALAHELVHVLTNSGTHVDFAGNLMRDQTTPKNTHLNGAQCAQLREAGTRNGLLRSR